MSKLFKDMGEQEKDYFDCYTCEDFEKYGIDPMKREKGYSLEAGPVVVAAMIAAAIAAIVMIVRMVVKYIKNRAGNMASAEDQVRTKSKNFEAEVAKFIEAINKSDQMRVDFITKQHSGGWKLRDLLIFQKKITESMIQEAIKEDQKHMSEYHGFVKEISDKVVKKLPDVVNKLLVNAEAKEDDTSKQGEIKKAMEELEQLKATAKEITDKHADIFKFDRSLKLMKIIKPDFSHTGLDPKKASQDELRVNTEDFVKVFKEAIKSAGEKIDITEAVLNGAGELDAPKADTVLPAENVTKVAAEKEADELEKMAVELDNLEKNVNSKYKDKPTPPAAANAAKSAIAIVRSTITLTKPLSTAIYDIYLSHLGLYNRYIEVAIVLKGWTSTKDKPKGDAAAPAAEEPKA